MDNILLVYSSIFGITLLFFLFSAMRNDESGNRKLAKVRVRVEENRRRPSLPPEEEGERSEITLWALLAAALFLILMAVNAA